MQRTSALAEPRRLRLAALCLTGLALLAAPAKDGETAVRQASGAAVPAALSQEGWKLLSVPGRAPADFTRQSPDGIRVAAENAVAFLYRPLAGDTEGKRRLTWRWRVDEPVARTDLSKVGEDDRSLAVHLVFPIERESLSFWDRIDLALTGMVAPPLAGKVLTYVWGGTQAQGARLPNPHLEAHGKIIVLRSGDAATGRWFMEEVDFVADFRAAFGYDPPAPAFMAISSDSDDTAGSCLGIVAGLEFG